MKVYLSPSAQPNNAYAGTGTTEQIQCNRIADYARQALIKNGYDAMKAPEGQNYDANTAQSNAWGADLHIPIHTNAGGGDGTVVFAHPSSVGNRYVQKIYNQVAALSPGGDDGVKAHTELYEINASNCMCVYVECEFHDNGDLASWIINNVKGIGEAIARGVCIADGRGYTPLDDGNPAPPEPSPQPTPKPTPTGAKVNMMGQRGANANRQYSGVYDASVAELQQILVTNAGYDRAVNGIADEAIYQFMCRYTVELNDRGNIIRWMQKRLDILGYNSGGADGYAEQQTMDAIARFQTAYGLGVGYLGGTDWYYMIES